MELIHVATLIHDDVVDNAATRRGVNATAVDFGNRVSVLAGDYLFAWIFKNVTANYPHADPTRALGDARRDLRRRGLAAAGARQPFDCRCDRYVEIARKKTASLFAAVGGVRRDHGRRHDPARSQRFALSASAIGIAFQMNDDLLDMTADERSLGKPAGNDLLERKMTIPLMRALARGDADFRAAGRQALLPTETRTTDSADRRGDRRAGRPSGDARADRARSCEQAKAALEPIAAERGERETGAALPECAARIGSL